MPIKKTIFGENIDIENRSLVDIQHAKIGNDCIIYAFVVIKTGVVIGDNVIIHDHVSISENVVIGDNVIIHSGCTVIKGIRLDTGCVIGAGSVITKNVERGRKVYTAGKRIDKKA